MKKAAQIGFVACFVALLLSFAKNEIQDKNEMIVEKNNTIDSLRDEIFIKHTTLCRYEMTLELLYEQDKQAAAKFDSIYNNETE